MAFNDIHNALTDMLNDMDIADFFEGTVEQPTDTVYLVTVQGQNKYAVIQIEYLNNFSEIDAKIVEFRHMSPLFAQLLLENLVIQINPDYYG